MKTVRTVICRSILQAGLGIETLIACAVWYTPQKGVFTLRNILSTGIVKAIKLLKLHFGSINDQTQTELDNPMAL
jgi:hypothetical protein